MRIFSFCEGTKKLLWGSRTRDLNVIRTFSSGIVWGIVMLAISLGFGCGDDDVGGPAGDDGVVAGHISFVFDGEQYSGKTCIANAFPGENSTSITSGGDENDWTLMLEIPGTAPGQFDEDAGATCSFIEPPFGNYDAETVTIAVTDYGKVGGVVKGTFAGMLISQLDSTRKQITEGIFTAQRHPDVE